MSALPDFRCAPAEPRLQAGEVHLWRADLDRAFALNGELLEPLLSTAEWMRTGRFHFEQDRRRSIATRGLLRSILGRYTRIAPAELLFGTGPHGKPQLLSNFGGWHFNLSHSGPLFLLAISQGRELGVDLEFMRDNVPFEALAAEYFEPEETLRILGTPLAERARHFYHAWTCTEARLKAAGTGFATGERRLVQPDRWSMRTLTPADGFTAALAVEGDDFQLHCWSWPN